MFIIRIIRIMNNLINMIVMITNQVLYIEVVIKEISISSVQFFIVNYYYFNNFINSVETSPNKYDFYNLLITFN